MSVAQWTSVSPLEDSYNIEGDRVEYGKALSSEHDRAIALTPELTAAVMTCNDWACQHSMLEEDAPKRPHLFLRICVQLVAQVSHSSQ